MSTPHSHVTVLLPAYEAEEFIHQTLDAISAQTSNNFSVIVSVDACSDRTFEICLAHAARDNRFLVLKQEKRLGYVGNCNFLLSQVDHDFAMFAFHDDILAATYIEKLAYLLDENPDAALSYSDLELININGTKERCQFVALEDIDSRTDRGLLMLYRPSNWWVPNRGIFRMSLARKVCGLKTHAAGEFTTDWPWLFHLSLTGPFVRVPETLCFKYYKHGSLSRSWDFSPIQFYEVTVSCMREIWLSDLTSQEKLQLAVPLIKWLDDTLPKLKATETEQ